MTKLEEVATALRLYVQDNDPAGAREAARAAIEALREPNEAMDEAGYRAMLHWPDGWHEGPPAGITSEWFQSRQAFQWMIDAILGEGE